MDSGPLSPFHDPEEPFTTTRPLHEINDSNTTRQDPTTPTTSTNTNANAILNPSVVSFPSSDIHLSSPFTSFSVENPIGPTLGDGDELVPLGLTAERKENETESISHLFDPTSSPFLPERKLASQSPPHSDRLLFGSTSDPELVEGTKQRKRNSRFRKRREKWMGDLEEKGEEDEIRKGVRWGVTPPSEEDGTMGHYYRYEGDSSSDSTPWAGSADDEDNGGHDAEEEAETSDVLGVHHKLSIRHPARRKRIQSHHDPPYRPLNTSLVRSSTTTPGTTKALTGHIHPPRRRRSRSLSGDELFVFMTPEAWERARKTRIAQLDQYHARPQPVYLPDPSSSLLSSATQNTTQHSPSRRTSGGISMIPVPMIPEDGRLAIDPPVIVDSPRMGVESGLELDGEVQPHAHPPPSMIPSQPEPPPPPLPPQGKQTPDSSLLTPSLLLPPPSGADTITTTVPSSPSFPPLPTPSLSTSSLLSVGSSTTSIPKFTPPSNFVQSPKPAVLRVGPKDRSTHHQQSPVLTSARPASTSHPSSSHHNLASSPRLMSPRLRSPRLTTTSPRLVSSSPRSSPSNLYATTTNTYLPRSDIGSPKKSASSRLSRQSSLSSSSHVNSGGSWSNEGGATVRLQRTGSRRQPIPSTANFDGRKPQGISSSAESRRQQYLPNPAHSPPVFISHAALSGSQWQQRLQQQYYSQQQQQQQQQQHQPAPSYQQQALAHPSRPTHQPSSSTSSRATTMTQPSPPNPVSLTTSPRSPAGHSLSPRTPQSTMLSPAPLPSMSILSPHPPHPHTHPHPSHHHQSSSISSSIAILSPPSSQPASILSPKLLPYASIISPKSLHHVSMPSPKLLPAVSILEEGENGGVGGGVEVGIGGIGDEDDVQVDPPHRSESPGWQIVGSNQSWTSPRFRPTSSSSMIIAPGPIGSTSASTVVLPLTSSTGSGVAATVAEFSNPSLASLVKSPAFTPFSSVHLQIDEMPTEGDSEDEIERQQRQNASDRPMTGVKDSQAQGGSTSAATSQAALAQGTPGTHTENAQTPPSEQSRVHTVLPTPSPRIGSTLGSDGGAKAITTTTTTAQSTIAQPVQQPRPPQSVVQVPITPISNLGEEDAVVGDLGGSGSGSARISMLGLDEPPTPPATISDAPLPPEVIEEALEKAIMPWSRKEREDRFGVLPMRKIVKRVERGQWEGWKVDDVPRESALWRLVRAQRLWTQGNSELFKLKHPSGLPRDHKFPKTQFVEDGEPLKAIEILVQSILLDPRVVAFKSPEARKDFIEQVAWQIFADARHVGWQELTNEGIHLDNVFATADARSHATGLYGGAISTRRALASFIRNHIVLAILEEQDGFTQRAILKYGRALDIIDWVNQALGPAPDKVLYGKGDAKQRVEVVYEGVFGRAVQIRLGHTLVAQYNFIKREKRYSPLRNDLLAEILQGSLNLFESIGSLVMNPHVQKDLTIEVYVSDFVYHVAHAHFFQGFYGRESTKIILDLGQASPRGGRPATEIARERSASSAQAFIQAALLFPQDEEERIQCFEMALEEMLKVGGLRVGEVLAIYDSLREARTTTDKVWNHRAPDDDDEVNEAELGLFDEEATAAAKKKKKKKKKKKEAAPLGTVAGDGEAIATTSTVVGSTTNGEKASPPSSTAIVAVPRDPATPKTPGSTLSQTQPRTAPILPFLDARAALLDNWFNTLNKSQGEKRIMNGDVLHPAPNLRGRPEVVWTDVTDDEGDLEEMEEDSASVPWASWGMKSLKTTKWGDLMKDGGGSHSSGTKQSGTKTNVSPTKRVKISTEAPSVAPASATGQTTALPSASSSTSTGIPIPSAASRLTQTPKNLPMPLGSSPEKIKAAIKAIKDSPARILATLAPEGSPKKSLAGRKIPVELYELLKSPDLKPLEDALKEAEAEVQAQVQSQQGGCSPTKENPELMLKPAASHWDRPTPWSIVQRLTKQKLFAIDLDAFDAVKRKPK